MIIEASQLGKRYNKEWIFKDFNHQFNLDETYAITGANGSGKSTLLQILAGVLLPSQGNCNYYIEGKKIAIEDTFKHFSFVSPYMELIEELTLNELINFHIKFKSIGNFVRADEFAEKISLKTSLHKSIQFFSSGMKQKIKLALCLYSSSQVLFLDEPTVNLDLMGIEWYKNEIKQQIGKKIIIICSNQNYEYDFCTKIFQIKDYKLP